MTNSIRINRFLVESGFCSRRQADKLIIEGRVLVNNHPAKVGDQVLLSDQVSVDNQQIKVKSEKIYIALNKPSGYICTLNDEFNRKNARSLINIKDRLFSVGRLDKESCGLIIYTNDGEFAQKVGHPSNQKNKLYRLELQGDHESIKQLPKSFLRGMRIEGKLMKVDEVRVIKSHRQTIVVEVAIHQGLNRQLRKMSEALGLKVRLLERIKIGNLKLGSLQPGKWRKINKEEVL